MKFLGKIKKATWKLTVHSRGDVDNYIASLGHEDKDVDIVIDISVKKKVRTLSQNAYYRALLRIILRHIQKNGEPPEDLDTDDLHHLFCMKFHYYEITNEETGEITKFPRKTRNMSTEEFGEMIEHIKRWTVDHLKLYLPEPGEEFQLFNMENN